MERDFKFRKRLILTGLTLLIGADLALGAYSWRLSSAPRTPREQLNAEAQQLELLRADIRRAEQIKQNMPHTKEDCDKFERGLRTESAGYSAVTAEIGAIAAKSSLHVDDLAFKQKSIPNRNIDVVDLDLTVNGDYASVVRFINGLQRSESVYEVDGLAVAGDSQNKSSNAAVRVQLHMRTYFRAV
jgi:Tfp pilus assembly protein PilO